MNESTDHPSPAPAGSPAEGLRLLVAIPALNEEATIADVIGRIPEHIPGVISVDVLVVDDASTDATKARAIDAGAEVVSHTHTQGVGTAFQTALTCALERGVDLIVSIDADGQFDPGTIPALVAPVVDGKADFATAPRFADPALEPDMPRIKRWGNRVMSRLISRLIGQEFHDVSCGMRCYSRTAAMHLNLLGAFTYTQEVFLNLAFLRMRMAEVPIRVGDRKHGTSRVAQSLCRYAFKSLGIIFRSYRDYRPFAFFGRIALALIVPAVALEGFLLIHYLATGSFSPHKWAGFLGAGLFALGLMMLHMALVGDMLNRHRVYLEEMLFRLRKNESPSDKRE